MHSSNGKALNELERIIMSNVSGVNLSWEKLLDEVILVREKLACATERQEYWEARARSAEAENAEYEAQIEASNKQEPDIVVKGNKVVGYNHNGGQREGYFYTHPQAPVNAIPDWEAEAKRAFWTGLEIGATFGPVNIQPRWIEYIEKRKGELAPQPDNDRSKDGEV